MFDVKDSMQTGPQLSADEFEQFRRFIYDEAGIDLAPNKRALVQSRLANRLRALQCESYDEYWRLLCAEGAQPEREQAVNMLSTNETYFFREPQHFEWLGQWARRHAQERQEPLRIWSAACSTGEEPYSIAMTLAESLGMDAPWYVYATDINTRVTRYAKRAVYPIARAEKTPPYLWQKYFQHGKEEYVGKIRVKPELAKRVEFGNVNLLHCALAKQRDFDLIILRNVLIYFDEDVKNRVVTQLCSKLSSGGYLLIGHAEVIKQPHLPLKQEAPSRYLHIPAAQASRGVR